MVAVQRGPIRLYRDARKTQMDPEAIAQAREARGWKREKCAVELGVSLATLSRWENGTAFPLPGYQMILERFIDETNDMLRTGVLSTEGLSFEVNLG